MCDLLCRLWTAMPDQRMGQLMDNLLCRDDAPPEPSGSPTRIWVTEDDITERKLIAAVEHGLAAAWRTR